MTFSLIDVKQEESVAVLTLNNPQKLNALNRVMVAEIGRAFSYLAEKPDIRAVLIAGSERSFAAGADIEEIEALQAAHQAYDFALERASVYDKIYCFPKPVVAAISGYALGGGCELALAADIRLAADNAKLGLPEVSLGILPGCGIQRLTRLTGPGIARELLFTGNLIGAAEAYRIGLVNRVVPVEALADEAMALAKQLAQKPPWALRLIKQAATLGQNTDLPTGMELERLGFALLFSTEDMREGVKAFLEKRSAFFQGN